jgi:hypothetical protein
MLEHATAPLHLADRGATWHLWTAGEQVHLVFDRSGRLRHGHDGARHFRMGFDTAMLERTGPRSQRISRRLEATAALPTLADVAAFAGAALEALERGAVQLVGSAVEAGSLLAAAQNRDDATWKAEGEAFRRTYKPVPILPPDCQRAVVVQVTEGCSYNRCRFCELYRDVPYRVKETGELATHLAQICTLLGPAMALRNRVFLGDANAVLVPTDTLLTMMAATREVMPRAAAGGFHAFIDSFSGAPIDALDIDRLASAGLRRLYLGLETGDPALRGWLAKPGAPARAIELVQTAHAAGLSIGAIVLVGAGGTRWAPSHLEQTLEVLRAMRLRRGDLVFLSPLVAHPGGDYAQAAARDDVTPLDQRGLTAQAGQFRIGLGDSAAKVALYDIQRWIYG